MSDAQATAPAAPPAEAPGAPRTDAVAVALTDVSVHYRVPRERVASFKHYAIRWLQRKIAYDSFLALQGITLEIRRGEVFGIIGPNGAGKSTLLKVVARVLRPTTGRVRVFGVVAPLLELGAGFDHELTGRENVFLNGAILGHRRADIAERFDRIVEFAGLRDFIDAPLRTYSSGMVARLGFAVATDVDPEILIVDEVLAVGDAEFQRKSRERLDRIRDDGATVLVVSHQLQTIRGLCSRAAWLDHGRLRALGSSDEVVDQYEASQR
jgi:ABC-2 type transport system ATP-binding protein/lipopolysaccharide transport system ATP-binding protein